MQNLEDYFFCPSMSELRRLVSETWRKGLPIRAMVNWDEDGIWLFSSYGKTHTTAVRDLKLPYGWNGLIINENSDHIVSCDCEPDEMTLEYFGPTVRAVLRNLMTLKRDD